MIDMTPTATLEQRNDAFYRECCGDPINRARLVCGVGVTGARYSHFMRNVADVEALLKEWPAVARQKCECGDGWRELSAYGLFHEGDVNSLGMFERDEAPFSWTMEGKIDYGPPRHEKGPWSLTFGEEVLLRIHPITPHLLIVATLALVVTEPRWAAMAVEMREARWLRSGWPAFRARNATP